MYFFFLEYTDIIQNIRKGVRTMYINLINLKRWCLLIYSIFSAVVTVIYIMFNSTFYKLDLVRYSNDINYYNKMSAILPKGLLQLNGNFSQLNSPLLIIVYLLGVLICLISLILNWEPINQQAHISTIYSRGIWDHLVNHLIRRSSS